MKKKHRYTFCSTVSKLLVSERGYGKTSCVMPPALSRELDTIDMLVKVRIIMAGLGGSYIHEWAPIYREIANFVYGIYKERDRLYREIERVP